MEEKKETKEKSMEGVAYGMQVSLAKEKNTYITSIINARYFTARCNMIAAQIIAKKIKEKIDGCLKTEEFFRAEYAHQKKQAINCMRDAHFAKRELMGPTYKLTEEDIFDLEADYYDGKIIREEYDEGYKKKGKAEFVDTSKD